MRIEGLVKRELDKWKRREEEHEICVDVKLLLCLLKKVEMLNRRFTKEGMRYVFLYLVIFLLLCV